LLDTVPSAPMTGVEKMLGRMIGEEVELRTVKGPGLGLVRADSGQIEQVIVNLAINARDAMPKGGRLFINTSVAAINEVEARQIPGATPGDYVCLIVKDTGIEPQ